MSNKKPVGDNSFDAAKTIYQALAPLDENTRKRVILSALSLLGMDVPQAMPSRVVASDAATSSLLPHQRSERPLSPVELIQQKQPSTNSQRIALFAYYREKAEGKSRFSRVDLKEYFAKARLNPPQNYDRDFNTTVQLGYIYEDGDESYLTSKGLEAVEAGFEGKAEPRGKAAARKKKRLKAKKARRKK
jgi:hypothetical protein